MGLRSAREVSGTRSVSRPLQKGQYASTTTRPSVLAAAATRPRRAGHGPGRPARYARYIPEGSAAVSFEATAAPRRAEASTTPGRRAARSQAAKRRPTRTSTWAWPAPSSRPRRRASEAGAHLRPRHRGCHAVAGHAARAGGRGRRAAARPRPTGPHGDAQVPGRGLPDDHPARTLAAATDSGGALAGATDSLSQRVVSLNSPRSSRAELGRDAAGSRSEPGSSRCRAEATATARRNRGPDRPWPWCTRRT